MFRESDPKDLRWKSYIELIRRNHCPFLNRAADEGLVKFSEYRIDGEVDKDEYAFSLALIHTEILRAERSGLSGSNSRLICENIIFTPGFSEPAEREIFFQWIHWALKLLYTDSGVVFGKFWPDEIFYDDLGKRVPNPPEMLLSIRSTVGEKDAKFFKISPLLSDKHKNHNKSSVLSAGRVFGKKMMDVQEHLSSSKCELFHKECVESFASSISKQKLLRMVISEDAFGSLAR
ncbi:MAG: hypothetical protein V5B34_04840 [Accumulibacter sp.]